MKFSTASEIFAMDDGDIIKAVRVKIKKVWDYKSGEGTYGPWSFQNLTGSIDGKDVTLSLQKREKLPQAFVGKTVVVLACQGEKGWSGVYASDNTYTGKDGQEVTKRVIKVTEIAEITSVEEMAEDAGEPTAEEAPSRPAAPSQSSESGFTAARVHIVKSANLYLLAMRGAKYVGETFENENPGMLITPEQFQSICASLYIDAARAGMIANMTTSPLPPPVERPKKPKAKKEPAPKPEPASDEVSDDVPY